MLIGYVRVSKSDGTQTLAPQRDAMLAAGVDPSRIYEDLASGRMTTDLALPRVSRRSSPATRSFCGSLTGSVVTCVIWSTQSKTCAPRASA
jgi:hypothetical protein